MAAATSLLKKQYLVVLFLVLSSAAAVQSVPLRTWHIHVVNGLSGGQALFVHCKSKDDDLGGQNLGGGNEFSWTFKVNLWNTTLFWCYLRKPNGGQVSFESFWVESQSVWLFYRCYLRNCIWTAKDDGVYLRNNLAGGTDFLVHTWK